MKKSSSLQQLQNELRSKYTPEKISPEELLRIELLSSQEKFTRAMFKSQYKRPFIMNEHFDEIFRVLQDVVDGKCNRLLINMPPRYGKTEVAIKSFVAWGFALNPRCKFLHLSYSDLLVKDNSETIRLTMQEPLYKTLFPESALEKDKSSTTRWKTKAGGEFYAVSTQGQVTGFGAGHVDDADATDVDSMFDDYSDVTSDSDLNDLLGLMDAKHNIFNGAILIDDPIKPEDAESDIIRERINNRFDTTIRNRVNSRKTPIIIIMQRLHEDDLCGRLLANEEDDWTVLTLSAIQTDLITGEDYPLWDKKHTLEELYKMRERMPIVFETQYMQDPKPKQGLMYQEGFKTYTPEQLPTGHNASCRWNYTDTADTGADFLCSICFIDTPEYVYVTDVLFTKDPMEITEPKTANMLARNKTVRARIESNNGGRGFSRAVKRLLRSVMRIFSCVVETFTQTDNKYSRIFSNSAGVMSDVLMPEGWDKMWPQFYNAITSYRKDTKRRSQHDDAPDALTGVYEMHTRKGTRRGIRRAN